MLKDSTPELATLLAQDVNKVIERYGSRCFFPCSLAVFSLVLCVLHDTSVRANERNET